MRFLFIARLINHFFNNFINIINYSSIWCHILILYIVYVLLLSFYPLSPLAYELALAGLYTYLVYKDLRFCIRTFLLCFLTSHIPQNLCFLYVSKSFSSEIVPLLNAFMRCSLRVVILARGGSNIGA